MHAHAVLLDDCQTVWPIGCDCGRLALGYSAVRCAMIADHIQTTHADLLWIKCRQWNI